MNVPTIRHLNTTDAAHEDDELDQAGIIFPGDASQNDDPFRALPTKIIHYILIGHSSKDACILRLSSPVVVTARLPETF
ncbi:hypothetical protein TOPH_07618 [Tolypocladium ophioglossoides CBS 100239]|uniref:Uncharacterized protein n=1 Tax=Tolypocladium ophioglossoides (strain CBS 100239) TaxID=1163406 RepID=A0A0L0N172_TOLOC|nr:hypothetical protein TOPH_07618 [Tolypocladium ophioglossoides CBS 100239]